MGKRGSMSLPGWESSRGEQGRGHKLTEPQAREILALAGKGIAAHQLAKKYGVSTESVRGIWRRLTWKHLKHRCDQCGSENEPELDRTIATRLCKECLESRGETENDRIRRRTWPGTLRKGS